MIGSSEIINQFGVKPSVNVEEEVDRRVRWLMDYLSGNPFANGYLLGISGGIDSAVAAALCKVACDKCGKRFLGVLNPYYEDKDMQDVWDVVNCMDMEYEVRNIGEVVDFAVKKFDADSSKYRIGNRKARQRMVEWYDISARDKLIVVGTDHATESIVGYYTKYGDGGADITPLKTLDKRQIRQLAAYEYPFGFLPRNMLTKAPTAGLWDNQTDEDELGLTYEVLCDYLEGKDVPDAAVVRIESLYRASMHKRYIPYI